MEKIVFLFIFIMVLIAGTITIIDQNKLAEPSTPNYLGLARMGLMPTTNQCSFNDYKAYTSTGVIADVDTKQYLILESKFGNEYCPIRTK